MVCFQNIVAKEQSPFDDDSRKGREKVFYLLANSILSSTEDDSFYNLER